MEKYKLMFRLPQNGGSRGKESFQLSGEEVFLPTTAVKNTKIVVLSSTF